MSAHVVTSDEVERTIAAFTRLDQKGDKKAMNKLAQRLQKEQPFLLQHVAIELTINSRCRKNCCKMPLPLPPTMWNRAVNW